MKEAGIGKKEARGVGIVVDHRRRNLSEEGKALNVERLKAYKARLIVFPRNAKKPKKGDTTVSKAMALLLYLEAHVGLFRFRVTTSRLRSPVPTFPSLTPTPPRLLDQSPLKSETSKHTVLSVTSEQLRATRVLVRFGKPRFVKSSFTQY